MFASVQRFDQESCTLPSIRQGAMLGQLIFQSVVRGHGVHTCRRHDTGDFQQGIGTFPLVTRLIIVNAGIEEPRFNRPYTLTRHRDAGEVFLGFKPQFPKAAAHGQCPFKVHFDGRNVRLHPITVRLITTSAVWVYSEAE